MIENVIFEVNNLAMVNLEKVHSVHMTPIIQ